MIECYFRWCENHSKDEPFCNRDGRDGCNATKEQIIQFEYLRKKELDNYKKGRI